ncbi:MAG: hypothetical protein H8E09_00040 [Gammaproteobacteria bacterium]|nr:hypothetical protein [Gammaproteobacteria bacterium]
MIPHEKDTLMKQHLEQWQSSGTTQIAYCREHGIPMHVFSYYKKKLTCVMDQSAPARQTLIPVSVLTEQSTSSAINIHHHNGYSLAIPAGSNLAEFKPLLELIRSVS